MLSEARCPLQQFSIRKSHVLCFQMIAAISTDFHSRLKIWNVFGLNLSLAAAPSKNGVSDPEKERNTAETQRTQRKEAKSVSLVLDQDGDCVVVLVGYRETQTAAAVEVPDRQDSRPHSYGHWRTRRRSESAVAISQ
jgi:hypothetical protein